MVINIPVKKLSSSTGALDEIRLAAQLFHEQEKNGASPINPADKSRIAHILARAERSSGLSSTKILDEFFRLVQNNQRKKIEIGDNPPEENTNISQRGSSILLYFKKKKR